MSPLRGSLGSWGQHFATIMSPLRGSLKVESFCYKFKMLKYLIYFIDIQIIPKSEIRNYVDSAFRLFIIPPYY
jgi:hypothetical protein